MHTTYDLLTSVSWLTVFMTQLKQETLKQGVICTNARSFTVARQQCPKLGISYCSTPVHHSSLVQSSQYAKTACMYKYIKMKTATATAKQK